MFICFEWFTKCKPIIPQNNIALLLNNYHHAVHILTQHLMYVDQLWTQMSDILVFSSDLHGVVNGFGDNLRAEYEEW